MQSKPGRRIWIQHCVVTVTMAAAVLASRSAAAEPLGVRKAPKVIGCMHLPDGFAEQPITDALTGAVSMTVAPDGRVFICEQTGALRIVKDGRLLDEPLLSLSVDSAWERGLLGVAFDPQFPAEPYIYVLYVAPEPYPHHRVSRFTADGDRAAVASEVILFRGDDQRTLGGSKPAGHQGGGIRFGPDGMLYVSLGEQTAGEPSQSLSTLQGKILRLRADGSIPEDNPFYVQTTGKYRAIWARGLRNPFGLAFDSDTGRMFINDVGGTRYEEINEGVAGANYGWPIVEGPSTNPAFTPPLYSYGEGPQQSIAGGAFYWPAERQFPTQYVGLYFFVDYVYDWIRVIEPDDPTRVSTFATGLAGPVDVDVARDGSLYVFNRNAWVNDDKFAPGKSSLHRIFYVPNAKDPAPQLVEHPAERTVAAGEAALFAAVATGAEPLAFQWERDGAPIEGATGRVLRLAKTTAADKGARLSCIVSNAHGRVRTTAARLDVIDLCEAVGVGGLDRGLHVERYRGRFASLPPLDEARRVEPLIAETVAASVPWASDAGGGYALRLTGYVRVPESTAYRFELSASGPAKLWVAGREVVGVGSSPNNRRAQGAIGLAAGLHTCELVFANPAGAPTLDLAWSWHDRPLEPVPAVAWWHGAAPVSPSDAEQLARAIPKTLDLPADAARLPPTLSQTGLFRSLKSLEPAAGVLPYTVNSPLWADGAVKRHWIAVPAGGAIEFSPTGPWRFPEGTALVEHIEMPIFDGFLFIPLETRVLIVDGDGAGHGVTYQWRDDGKDADLLETSLVEELDLTWDEDSRHVRWYYPSRQDCMVCHSAAAGVVLGVNARQLNNEGPRRLGQSAATPQQQHENASPRDRTVPAAAHLQNRKSKIQNRSQLLAWSEMGLFTRPLEPSDVASLPRLVDVADTRHPLADRVRSYLDANCAHCHHPSGVRGAFDARFTTPLDQQNLVGVKPVAADLGLPAAAIVAPGDPAQSMLYLRMNRRMDAFNMPPLATYKIDDTAAAVVAEWIASLPRDTATSNDAATGSGTATSGDAAASGNAPSQHGPLALALTTQLRNDQSADVARDALEGRFFREVWAERGIEHGNPITNPRFRVNAPEAVLHPNFGGRKELLSSGMLQLLIDEDPRAIDSAELYLELWGGHAGTANRRVTINGRSTYAFPLVGGETNCTHLYPRIALKLSDLVPSYNALQFACDQGSTFWGHYIVEGAAIRAVLKDDDPRLADSGLSEFRPELAATPARDGAEAIELSLDVPSHLASRIERVDFIGHYLGYDENGDTDARDWHGYTKARQPAAILGSADAPPYHVRWDTSMLPAQRDMAAAAIIRFRDPAELAYRTEAMRGLSTPARAPEVYVRLLTSKDVPDKFVSRADRLKTCTIDLDVDPARIDRAELHVIVWGSGPGAVKDYFKLNGRQALTVDEWHHDVNYQRVPIDPTWLVRGANRFELLSDTEHHGIEVLLPGPALVVRTKP